MNDLLLTVFFMLFVGLIAFIQFSKRLEMLLIRHLHEQITKTYLAKVFRHCVERLVDEKLNKERLKR